MPKVLKVFIGSSTEQRSLVEWLTDFIAREYAGRLEPVPWYLPWPGGRYTLENLLSMVADTDAAILFWTADDRTWYRQTEVHEPRDNLTFEAGLFIATHGRERTQLMLPDYPEGDLRKAVKVPTDLQGLTYNLYTWRDGPAEATGLPNRARTVCEGLALLSPRYRRPQILNELSGLESVEEICTFVGEWRTIHINGIARLAQRDDARMIDVLVAYRIGEIARVLDSFRRRAGSQFRACFADVWDEHLAAVYQRKYYDRTPEYMKGAVKNSIERLLGQNELQEDPEIRVRRLLEDPPVADYQLRLTSQRITYGYYRIDNCMFIVPLDMKRNQNPAPFAWVLERESAPKAFAHYLQEFDRMFAEARTVFP